MIKLVHKDSRGFTLIEILVTIAILAIVFGVVVTAAARAQKQARDAQRQSDLKKIQGALQQYYTDQGFYPSSVFWGSMGIPQTRSMQLDSLFYTNSGLTNCTGVADSNFTPPPCVVNRVYMSRVPGEPLSSQSDPTPYQFHHYCYQAYTSKAEFDSGAVPPGVASSCRNSAAADRCQYYRLYASLETSGSTFFNCNDGSGAHSGDLNFVVTPLGN